MAACVAVVRGAGIPFDMANDTDPAPGGGDHPLGGRRPPRRRLLLGGILLAAVAAALGPRARVEEPDRPVDDPWGGLGAGVEEVERILRAREEGTRGIRPGDGAEVVWADPLAPTRTALAVVYLHGFSADRHEMDPVPQGVAEALGANLLLTRLTGHGQDGAALGDATAADWLRDTDEALAAASRLGERVVLIGTSTGGTLAVWGAGRGRWGGSLAALVLVSPNFGPRDRSAEFLLWPWGGLLARLLVGPERCFEPFNEAQARHWTTCYPTRALLPMMALVDHVRRSGPGRVTAPLLVLYSPEDVVVDAAVTEALFPAFASPVKALVPVQGSGDPAQHVLAGDILSPSTTDEVVERIVTFVLHGSAPPP